VSQSLDIGNPRVPYLEQLWVSDSVAESHNFYAVPAPAPSKNFDAAPAPASILLYSKAKVLKQTKV
jgi:hypothetical protein